MKTAKWQDLSFDQQKQYMKHHPKSKFHVTSVPSDSDENIELFNIRKTMGNFNSMVEGKLPVVQNKANEWIEKLQSLGFEKIKDSEESKIFAKDDLQAEVGTKKGKMRYFSYFEIKPMEDVMNKAAVNKFSYIMDEDIISFVKTAVDKQKDIPLQYNDKLEQRIMEFFKNTPPKSDEDVHALAERLGVDKHELEQKIYEILSSFLSEGRFKKYDGPTFDEEQIQTGIEVEKEHTSNPALAERITLDHLSEFDDYYTRLTQMEEEAKND